MVRQSIWKSTCVWESRLLTLEARQYLAGFFDGEGTVGLYYHKGTKAWRPTIRITQNYSGTALWQFQVWQQQFGGGIVVAKRPRLDITLQLQSEASIRMFIGSIGPYTVLKKAQLHLLLVYLDTRTYPYRIHQQLKAMKREGRR